MENNELMGNIIVNFRYLGKKNIEQNMCILFIKSLLKIFQLSDYRVNSNNCDTVIYDEHTLLNKYIHKHTYWQWRYKIIAIFVLHLIPSLWHIMYQHGLIVPEIGDSCTNDCKKIETLTDADSRPDNSYHHVYKTVTHLHITHV